MTGLDMTGGQSQFAFIFDKPTLVALVALHRSKNVLMFCNGDGDDRRSSRSYLITRQSHMGGNGS